MADAYICRRGGSGASLVLTAVGNPRPTSPQQNTIWVDTDTEITGWAFSATEPENPIDGLMWVTIGATGSVKVASPVGGDWITVYPILAKQNLGGTWVNKIAQSYQDGAWADWVAEGVLYDKGNQCEHVTGGWYTPVSDTGNVVYNSGSIFIEQTMDKNAYTQVATRNKIDLSGYSTLKINVTELSRAANSKPGLTVAKTLGGSITRVATQFIDSTGVVSLDVSTISEELYICVYAYYGTNWQMTFDKVWLE